MKVDNKVICIDDEFTIDSSQPDELINTKFPVKEKQYTIRKIENFFGIDCILLKELVNEKIQFDDMLEPIEISWPANRFRLV